jgi:hypothetical protein
VDNIGNGRVGVLGKGVHQPVLHLILFRGGNVLAPEGIARLPDVLEDVGVIRRLKAWLAIWAASRSMRSAPNRAMSRSTDAMPSWSFFRQSPFFLDAGAGALVERLHDGRRPRKTVQVLLRRTTANSAVAMP